jgi:hypothetical protein
VHWLVYYKYIVKLNGINTKYPKKRSPEIADSSCNTLYILFSLALQPSASYSPLVREVS